METIGQTSFNTAQRKCSATESLVQGPSVSPFSGWRALLPWVWAARPKTLTAGLLPVLLASGYSAQDHALPLTTLLLPIGFALCMQVGVNYHNDLCDGLRGADGPMRAGPARALASGWIGARSLQRAVWISWSLGLLLALPLAWMHLWVVPLALLSVVGALCYTGGPRPLAYRGGAELLCLLFFGWSAFLGTAALQGTALTLSALALATGCGSWAVALIAINNIRDRDGDAVSGKRTLAVRWGHRFAQAEIACALLLPSLCALVCGSWGGLLSLFLALPLVWQLPSLEGKSWNTALARTSAGYLLWVLGILLQWLGNL